MEFETFDSHSKFLLGGLGSMSATYRSLPQLVVAGMAVLLGWLPVPGFEMRNALVEQRLEYSTHPR